MFTQSFNHFCPGWQALGARERRKGFNKAEVKIRGGGNLRYNNSFNKRLLLVEGKIIHIFNPQKANSQKTSKNKAVLQQYQIVHSGYTFKVKCLITK